MSVNRCVAAALMACAILVTLVSGPVAAADFGLLLGNPAVSVAVIPSGYPAS